MQGRRVISTVLIPATLLLFTGCTKTVWVGPEELRPEQRLKGVVTADGQIVELDPWAATLRGDTIYADTGEDALRFALDEVSGVGVERENTVATVAVIVGVALALVWAIGLATWEMPGWGNPPSDSPFEY